MIYDLKELNQDVNLIHEYGNPPSDVDKAKIRAMLAIAERLEALVEAQKPRWVEFEGLDGQSLYVDANAVVGVSNCNGLDDSVGTDIFVRDGSGDGFGVKATPPEVLSKLRGEG